MSRSTRSYASRFALAAAGFLAFAPARNALASILPSFHAARLTWDADDIVIATEDGALDGHIRVLSTLVGTLHAGDTLEIPQLAHFAPAAMRRVDCTVSTTAPCVPMVTGQRFVLFLYRVGPGSFAPASSVWRRQRGYTPLIPLATASDGYIVSLAWIEHGEAYGYQQFMNPGPQILARVGTEADLVVDVISTLARRAMLSAALAEPDLPRRARALFHFLALSNEPRASHFGEDETLEAIARLGPTALPALRAMLEEPAMRELRPDLLRTMARIGGASVTAELVSVITREWGFWTVTAPSLQVGWWNGTGLAWAEVERLRDRYMELYAAIQALEPLHAREARAPIERLRTLWTSYPALDDRSGLHQIVEACDQVLAGIPP